MWVLVYSIISEIMPLIPLFRRLSTDLCWSKSRCWIVFNIWTHKIMWWIKINNLNKVENSIDNNSIAEAHQFDWNQFYAISMWKNRIDKAIKLCKFHVINTLKGKQFQSFFLFAEIEREKSWDAMSTSIQLHALNINTKHNIQNRFLNEKCVLHLWMRIH